MLGDEAPAALTALCVSTWELSDGVSDHEAAGEKDEIGHVSLKKNGQI